MQNRTAKIMMGVAAVAVIVGVVIAITTSGGGTKSGHATTQPAGNGAGAVLISANYLGMTRAEIRSETRKGRTLAEIAASRSGKSAAGLIDAIVLARTPAIEALAARKKLSQDATATRLAALRAAATARVNGVRAVANARRRALSQYLGLPIGSITAQLQSGHSLAEIADATKGRSAAGLTAALTKAERAQIVAAQAAGRYTEAQAKARLAMLPRRVTRQIEHKAHAGGSTP